jgi:Cu-Zn family superoxide dismutase
MKIRIPALIFAVTVLAVSQAPARAQVGEREMRLPGDVAEAVCVLQPVGNSGVSGVVHFILRGNRVEIVGKVSGLRPGKHGFHVHQFGDLRSMRDGESAGGHFDPGTKHHHGAPDAHDRHEGDLGNIEANARGVAIINETDSIVRLNGQHSILGRSLVVHADPDRFIQPTGGAGARVAVGVIGAANPKFNR